MANVENDFEPYTFGTALIILVVATAADTVGVVVLLICSYIFMKKGHRGLSAAMCVVNFVAPDMIPVIDEGIQFVVVVIPLIKGEGKSVQQRISASKNSLQTYNDNKQKLLK